MTREVVPFSELETGINHNRCSTTIKPSYLLTVLVYPLSYAQHPIVPSIATTMIDLAPFIAAVLRDNSVQDLYDEMKCVWQKVQICAYRLGEGRIIGSPGNCNTANLEDTVSAAAATAPAAPTGFGNIRRELILTVAEVLRPKVVHELREMTTKLDDHFRALHLRLRPCIHITGPAGSPIYSEYTCTPQSFCVLDVSFGVPYWHVGLFCTRDISSSELKQCEVHASTDIPISFVDFRIADIQARAGTNLSAFATCGELGVIFSMKPTAAEEANLISTFRTTTSEPFTIRMLFDLVNDMPVRFLAINLKIDGRLRDALPAQ
jgi:hypothetical protein